MNEEQVIEQKEMSKTDILTKMREHQQEYAFYATELKKLTAVDDRKALEERQLKRLAEYKIKYKLFLKRDGYTKDIDWEEVENLIRKMFDTGKGYSLGFNSEGFEGLACIYEGNVTFEPMVEDEVDARRMNEREKRRREFSSKNK